MATPSSSKKIQRVQRAGVSRVAGQRRPVGFPAAVIGIIIVGSILVWFARDARINVDGDRPRVGIDTWYEAYGTYQCDEYLENLSRPSKAADIESLGNGVILVGPNSEETSGANAVFSHFFDAQGMKVTDDSVTFADGTVLKAGDTCGEGEDATDDTVIKMFLWPPQSSDKTEPKVIDSNFGDVRFEQSGAAFALALVPADTDQIDLPGAVDRLSAPDQGLPPRPSAEGETTTTVAGEVTTTVAGETTTTVAGETTTTAAVTTTTGG
ncbi:MAG: hypothetical protein GX868_09625 [Actinobacteria bacterium]|nr:hypothetical protein [Actinomycetota bacterium]